VEKSVVEMGNATIKTSVPALLALQDSFVTKLQVVRNRQDKLIKEL
jgi:hypothetical protein